MSDYLSEAQRLHNLSVEDRTAEQEEYALVQLSIAESLAQIAKSLEVIESIAAGITDGNALKAKVEGEIYTLEV